MKTKILKLSKTKKNISLYLNPHDTSKFIFGHIISANDMHFVMCLVDSYGNYDGILVKEIDEIIRIELDDKYAKKIEKLIRDKGIYEIDLCLNGDDIIKEVLDVIQNANKIVSIEILHSGASDVIGFVDDVTDDICTIRQINSYGEEDGKTHIILNNITELSFDSVEENTILKLWNSTI